MKNCTRCKGKGFGSWVREHGVCFGCQGAGTREAQVRVREAAKAELDRIRETETVSVLVGPVAGETSHERRQAATIAYFEAFVGSDRDLWGGSPFFEAVADGWYIAGIRMHVASFLEEVSR